MILVMRLCPFCILLRQKLIVKCTIFTCSRFIRNARVIHSLCRCNVSEGREPHASDWLLQNAFELLGLSDFSWLFSFTGIAAFIIVLVIYLLFGAFVAIYERLEIGVNLSRGGYSNGVRRVECRCCKIFARGCVRSANLGCCMIKIYGNLFAWIALWIEWPSYSIVRVLLWLWSCLAGPLSFWDMLIEFIFKFGFCRWFQRNFSCDIWCWQMTKRHFRLPVVISHIVATLVLELRLHCYLV